MYSTDTMAHHFKSIILCLLASPIALSGGSRIFFTATPARIAVGSTATLQVTCSLQTPVETSQEQVQDYVTSSLDNILHVNAIVIRKVDGDSQREVARIVHGQPPEAGPINSPNTRITGNVASGENDDRNYLEVTWTPPGEKQSGSYNCEINTLDRYGKIVKFKANISVAYKSSSADDLTASETQEKQEETQEKQEERQENIGEQRREIDELKYAVQRLSTPHYEEGIIVCDNSAVWGPNMTVRECTQDVRFKAPYGTRPLVNVAVVKLDVEKTFNVRYRIDIRNVTTHGFKVACVTWWDTFIFTLQVRWTSTGI